MSRDIPTYSSCFCDLACPFLLQGRSRGLVSAGVTSGRSCRSSCEYVPCCVDISAQRETAASTSKRALTKANSGLVSALAAQLAGISCCHGDELASGCYRLVGKHLDEPSPGCVRDMFRQSMILDHASDIERFDSDEPIVLNKMERELMEKVRALAGNPSMRSGCSLCCLFAIHTFPFFAADAPLQFLETLLSPGKVSRMFYLLSGAQGCKADEAYINTDFVPRARVFPLPSFDLAAEDGPPTPVLRPFYRAGLDTAAKRPVHNDGDCTDTRKAQSLVGHQPVACYLICVRKGDAPDASLEPGKAGNFAKKSLICL